MIKNLVYADKIATPTDKRHLNLSLISGFVAAAVFAVLLILRLTLTEPIIFLFALLGALGGVAVIIAAIYTLEVMLRKLTLKIIFCLAFLLVTIGIIITVIII